MSNDDETTTSKNQTSILKLSHRYVAHWICLNRCVRATAGKHLIKYRIHHLRALTKKKRSPFFRSLSLRLEFRFGCVFTLFLTVHIEMWIAWGTSQKRAHQLRHLSSFPINVNHLTDWNVNRWKRANRLHSNKSIASVFHSKKIYITKRKSSNGWFALNGTWIYLNCHVLILSSWFKRFACNFKMDHLFKCKKKSKLLRLTKTSVYFNPISLFPQIRLIHNVTIKVEWLLNADSRGIRSFSFRNLFRIYCTDILHHFIIRPSRCIARIEWTLLTLIRHNNANSNKKETHLHSDYWQQNKWSQNELFLR